MSKTRGIGTWGTRKQHEKACAISTFRREVAADSSLSPSLFFMPKSGNGEKTFYMLASLFASWHRNEGRLVGIQAQTRKVPCRSSVCLVGLSGSTPMRDVHTLEAAQQSNDLLIQLYLV